MALLGVAFVTSLYKLVITEVNFTTIALSLLLVVLAIASKYGLGPGIVSSISGMICFNYFFIPPVGTFTVQDPQNWVALFAFLITAVIASQLSSAARSRAHDAERRREEVLKLYELSRAIIATPDSETAVSSIARQVAEVFGFDYCAVFVPDEAGRWRRLALTGELPFTPAQNEISNAYLKGEIKLSSIGDDLELTDREDKARLTVAYAPLKMGVRPMGVIALMSPHLERGTIEAIAGLVALALERARFLKEVSHTEALKQSDELKSALLASVSHDLRTPLTSIRASIDNLLQDSIEWDKAELREFHLIISEEVQRLTRLVQNLLEMARIEAGELRPSLQWESVPEMIYNVLDRCSASIRNHKTSVFISGDTPAVKIDSRLIGEALSNLVENAAKYSPAGSEIAIRAHVDLERNELYVSVIDQGPGIAPNELDRVFDKFYRGTSLPKHRSEGTGMGLAIARGIAQAHGGRIWVESQVGEGANFTIAIPVECKGSEEVAPAEESFS